MKQPAKPASNIFWARIDRWHKTRLGFAVFALVEAALCSVFASIAIDTGSLIAWTLTVILLFGTVVNLFQFLKKVIKG